MHTHTHIYIYIYIYIYVCVCVCDMLWIISGNLSRETSSSKANKKG